MLQLSKRTCGLAGALSAICLSACAPTEPASAPAPTEVTEGGSPTEAQKKPQADTTPASKEIALRFPRDATPWLGVELRAREDAGAGVEIVRVLPGSPAEHALLQSGDVLLAMGEVPAEDPASVANWVRAQDALSSHPLSVLRNGKPHLLRVELEGMPHFEDRIRLALVNRPAPEISGVATFQGEAASLGELRGQVVILEFWASYCGVCRYLAPRLDEWHRTFLPQGGQVFGITVDPPKLGMEVARRTGMSYTLASDVNAEVSRTYMASQIPVVIVIDRQGIVRDAMVGYSENRLAETERLIEKLLAHDS